MSEWSIEHAWKLTPAAHADSHEIPPTRSRSTTSHNNDVNQRVPVTDRVDPGFRGVCDTVLTQLSFALPQGTCRHVPGSTDLHFYLADLSKRVPVGVKAVGFQYSG